MRGQAALQEIPISEKIPHGNKVPLDTMQLTKDTQTRVPFWQYIWIKFSNAQLQDVLTSFYCILKTLKQGFDCTCKEK